MLNSGFVRLGLFISLAPDVFFVVFFLKCGHGYGYYCDPVGELHFAVVLFRYFHFFWWYFLPLLHHFLEVNILFDTDHNYQTASVLSWLKNGTFYTQTSQDVLKSWLFFHAKTCNGSSFTNVKMSSNWGVDLFLFILILFYWLDKTNIVKVSLWAICEAFLTILRISTNTTIHGLMENNIRRLIQNKKKKNCSLVKTVKMSSTSTNYNSKILLFH